MTMPPGTVPAGSLSGQTSRLQWAVPLILFTSLGLVETAQAWLRFNLTGTSTFVQPGQTEWPLIAIFVRLMPSWLAFSVFGMAAISVARRYSFATSSWQRALPVHIVAAATFAVVSLASGAWIRHAVFDDRVLPTFTAVFSRYMGQFFTVMIAHYVMVVGLFWGLEYYRQMRERDMTAEQLRRALSEAHLESLKRQLQPHFLFNTLNTAASLSIEGDTKGAVRVISLLGDLLRDVLRPSGQVVALEKELEMLKTYVAIQKIRFGDHIAITVDVDPDLYGAETPSLLLQPLVENAITHGIGRNSSPGWVTVRAFADDLRITVDVSDSGSGHQVDPVSFELGVGLRTTRERLQHLYGSAHEFVLRADSDGGLTVHMTWPLRYVV